MTRGTLSNIGALLFLAAAAVLVGVNLLAFDALIAFLERYFSADGSLKPSTRVLIELRLYGQAGFCVGMAALLAACSRGSFRAAARRTLLYEPESSRTPMPGRVLRFLLLAVAGLVLISVLGQYVRYELGLGATRPALFVYRYFNLDQEHWVPTTFSSLILLYSALLLANVAWRTSLRGERFVVHWSLLALAFLYLAIDEKFRVHEWAFDFLRPYLDVDVPVFWVVPAGLVTLLCALAYLPFVLHLPPVHRLLFVAAGSLYVGGAIGIEVVGRAYALDHGTGNMTYELLADAEELFEMLGVVTFIYGLQTYLQRLARQGSVVGSPVVAHGAFAPR